MKEMSVFPIGKPNDAYKDYFTGQSYLHTVLGEGVAIANVTFEKGCRNNWHIHHAASGGGQVLIVTAGKGYLQYWGEPARELLPGDAAYIPAGVKHWHGAGPDEPFQHLAFEVPGTDTSTEWLEKVSDEEYSKLK